MFLRRANLIEIKIKSYLGYRFIIRIIRGQYLKRVKEFKINIEKRWDIINWKLGSNLKRREIIKFINIESNFKCEK